MTLTADTAQEAPAAGTPAPGAAPGAHAAGPVGHAPQFGTKKAALQLVKGMKPYHVVEAALFAAGKPVSVEEIQNETGLPVESIKKAIKELQAEYEKRDTVLEVGKAGTKWAMQVRRQAAEPAARFAPMEIAPKLLKTLALIAYHQPMKQSELVEMVGSKAYDHVPELVERGLIRSREEGVTKLLTTTAAFPEYFGLDAANMDEIRSAMAKLVGLPPPEPKKAAKAEPVPAEGAASEASSGDSPTPSPETAPTPPPAS